MNQSDLSQKLEEFIPQLLAIAERNISSGLQRKFDADDVVVSVVGSLLRRAQEGRFQFSDNEELWKLVVVALKRKIYNKVRDVKAGKRDYTRETSFDKHAFLTSVSKAPTPDEAVEFQELLHEIKSRVDETGGKVLELKLGGLNNREIAAELDCNERTVGRKVLTIRNAITHLVERDE